MRNNKLVFNVIGVLLLLLGAFMGLSLLISLFYVDAGTASLFWSSALTIGFGFLTWWSTKNADRKMRKREGFLIVALGWTAISLFSALPYLLSGALPDLANALFESVSGLTTTGGTVIQDIESVPKGILFWRSLTQWIGGMGIIVLTIAILPLLGIGGVELFTAESPGPTSNKIHPRIKETAKRLWYIYCGFTLLLCLILQVEGMNFFDAINHSFTTLATGGYSTKDASIGYYNSPLIEYTITFFMFLGGVNYTLIYFFLKGSFGKVWQSDEFKAYVIMLTLMISTMSLYIFLITDHSLEYCFRKLSFMIISIVTTTGYVTADYTSWSTTATLFFFILLFTGACAGSTSGGIKVIRHLVLFKNTRQELRRLLHPRAIIRIKIDRKVVAPRVLTHILVFLLFYLIIFVIGTLFMSLLLEGTEQPFITAIASVASALGNVGPAIGEVGPMDTFANIPDLGKVFLAFLMLLGRLELFTILVLFSRDFWKKT